MSHNTTPTSLPSWPPSSLTLEQIQHLSHLATDYALSHGIVYRPLAPPTSASPVPPYDSVIHAPFSLLPSPFPRPLFQYAQSLQPTYDLLYASIASSPSFLRDVIGGSVSKVDSFQAALWHVYQRLQQDGQGSKQKLALGLFRSDYLLHRLDAAKPEESGEAVQLKQVEFNTISASFGALCTKVAGLHRHLAANSAGYFGAEAGKLADLERFPNNEALDVLSSGLASAHLAYLDQRNLPAPTRQRQAVLPSTPVVLFVVQEHERNAFDQRCIEHTLSIVHGIPVMRQTFSQLHTSAKLVGEDRHLFVTPPYGGTPVEVSVIYYRAGYGPSDYPSASEWTLREHLEKSYAIKCPAVALQLAGAKKVQQVLAERGMTERFLLAAAASSTTGGKTLSEHDVRDVRESYTDLYPLDTSELGEEAYNLAIKFPERYVLKPQREGGGNNIYRRDIPPALLAMAAKDDDDATEVKQREGYILMSLIRPPSGVGNWLVKAATPSSSSSTSMAVLANDVVSELGVYGSILYKDKAQEGEGQIEISHHKTGGFLLRTKARESDEGGVAVGFSVIDSPLLL